MNRPWKIWLLFALCLAVLLAPMGWVSYTALRLDRAQAQAALLENLEQKVRLALWRMDSSITPLFIEESARPPRAYAAFYGAERAYTKSFSQFKQGDVLVPSPLLTFGSSNILLHFQIDLSGKLSSPQVPSGSERSAAEPTYVSSERYAEQAARLAQFAALLRQPADARALAMISNTAPMALGLNGDVLMSCVSFAPVQTGLANNQMPAPVEQTSKQSRDQPQAQVAQSFLNFAEWNARANMYAQAQEQMANNLNFTKQQTGVATPSPTLPEGLFIPLWLGGELVLARSVVLEGRPLVQGCWIHWNNLKQSLLARVGDLFPRADLEPMLAPQGDLGARMLASLPVKLDPGPVDFVPPATWSPVRVSLAVAWACVLLAAVAVGVLLHGIVSLSERRGAFVSAVTHELRTPLTTFRMYSEMLADDMVPDAGQRKQYLATLCSEASRLSHLVENVLAYARLERGSARSRIEKVSLGELLARVKPRLLQRAAQAGMAWTEDCDARALQSCVHVDVAAVEQILFNLIDNACKYAAPTSQEKVIHLEALPAATHAKCVMLRVRDHGQGISEEGARRLFEPFCKSAHEAAHTAPGVGLGLALCRRLSRSMGGDLRWVRQAQPGACFELHLPIKLAGQAAGGAI